MDFYDYAWDYCPHSYLNNDINAFVICNFTKRNCHKSDCPFKKEIEEYISIITKEENSESKTN